MALVLDREGRVRAACRNPLTLVGRDICASHIMEVWDIIPKYIMEEVERGFGLRIPGLVSFNCKTVTYCSYPQLYTMDKFLHMVVSEDLIKAYGLKANRPPYTLPPVTNLNYSKITRDLNMPRYAVDACINEVIHAFKRAIVTYRHVKFVFEGIGTLNVRDNVITHSFEPSFLHVNGFGKRVMQYKTRFPCVCVPRRTTPQQHFYHCFQPESENEETEGIEDE